MSLAEGVQATVAYKAYATGAITANTKATSSSDPAASGGQFLRRVSSSLKLQKDTYKSNEIRQDRQITDFRHGFARVSGSISGEYSPATYFDFIEASCRGTKASAVTASQTDFTSVSASASGSTFTFAAGDAVTKGFRVGMTIRFANLSVSANNATNYVITSITGSQRVLGVLPAPTDMSADSSFTVASIGKSINVPSSSFVSRKFAFEHDFTDIDFSHLFTECRIGGFSIKLPATGLATIDIPVMGRYMETYAAGTAPFFTSPTAAGTTGIFAAVNGLLQVGGTTVGVVTGLDINMNLNPSAQAVVGQNFPPEIFLGPADVSGTLTAMLQDNTLVNDFVNETEISILAYLTTTSAVNSPANTIFLPRIKVGDAPVAVTGDGAQFLTIPFQALKSTATEATTGIAATTIQVCDTEAV